MRNILLCFFAALLLSARTAAARDYSVKDYKIVADGTTLNTTALQNLINKVSEKGGGRIVFPAGKYLTGQLNLKSNVELHLCKDAYILGSTSPFDYLTLETKNTDGDARKDNAHLGLIVSNGAKNIAITGTGTIDGQGLALALHADSLHHSGIYIDKNYNVRRQRPSELVRPTLFYLYQVEGLVIDSVHLKNSANWGVSLNQCKQARLTNLNIYNRAYWNNDGIDITDCKNVLIEKCNVNSADDGICLKSYDATTCNDSIIIRDCEVRSSASAIKFGTGSYGGFRNVSISHIRVFDTFRSAIAIESVDGGQIENIKVDDVVATNTGNAIFIRLGQRGGNRKGYLRHVSISNVFAQIPFTRPDINYDLRGPEVDYFHNIHPASICGIPGNDIEDVSLENIRIVYPGRATKGMAYMPVWRLQDVPENIDQYPEFTMFGELPSWAFYLRHVNGIRFSNVRLSLADSDYRPAFVLDDVKHAQIENLELPTDKSAGQIVLRNSECKGDLPASQFNRVK
jgi:hypothetical protein